MAKSPKAKAYQQLNQELATLVEWFESDQVNLDEATAKYEQALKIIAQMEAYLETAQNKVKKISAKFDDQ